MTAAIPAHVPADLVVDFDFYTMASAGDDLFAAWRAFGDQLRTIRGGTAQLVYTPHNGGHWIAATADAVEDLFANTRDLSNRSISIPSFGGVHILPGEGDGDEHMASRIAALHWFTPTRVRGLGEKIRAIAAELIDGFEAQGACDFMPDFASNIPMHLFFEMMELPLDDGRMLLDAAEGVIRDGDGATKIAAIQGVFDYLGAIVDARTAEPGDDLISHITQAQFRGERMPRDMALSVSVNVLLAGLDTVASMMGFIVRHLAGDPALRAELVQHPERIRGAVEEFARRFPVASLGRVVARDCSYGGIEMRAGERLFLATPLHSLDDGKFDRAMEIDLDRKLPTILSFGRGPHQCLGSLLARVELTEALTEWLARIPDFQIAPGKAPRVALGHITAMTSLPLSWNAPA